MDDGGNKKFLIPLDELKELPPEVAEQIISLVREDVSKRENARNLEIQYRNEQFYRDYNLKAWALFFSFVITCLSLFIGTWLVSQGHKSQGHKDAGIVTIIFGAGLTIGGTLIKKAAKWAGDKFLKGIE